MLLNTGFYGITATYILIGAAMGQQMARNIPLVASLAERIAFFRRLFARGCGVTPTVQIRLALDRAARLAARSEAAELDVATNTTTLGNLCREARLAKRDLDRLIATRPKSKPSSKLPGLLALHNGAGKPAGAPAETGTIEEASIPGRR